VLYYPQQCLTCLSFSITTRRPMGDSNISSMTMFNIMPSPRLALKLTHPPTPLSRYWPTTRLFPSPRDVTTTFLAQVVPAQHTRGLTSKSKVWPHALIVLSWTVLFPSESNGSAVNNDRATSKSWRTKIDDHSSKITKWTHRMLPKWLSCSFKL